MQNTTRLFVLLITLSCSLLLIEAKGTLFVDEIVPSATNSVYIQDLVADHVVATEANIQFLKLNPIPGSSFVADTLGPIGFDSSFLNFNSDTFVSLESGEDFNVETQESIASTGDELNFSSDRLFMTTTNSFIVNTHGSITGTSLRQHINSLSTLDVHTGVGSLSLLGGDSLRIGGQNVRLDGDDRVSLYSYNTLSIDALNNFQAYSAFIDFDTYGDIYIESLTGNVEVNSVRELVFLSDEINVSAPVGVELVAEHANVHVNAADNLFIDADDLVYIDVADEAFFTSSGEINAISLDDISLYAGGNLNIISRYIQYTGSEMNLDTDNTILDTGGDILMRMNAIPGLVVDYRYYALENIDFVTSNIVGNATYVSFESNLGDVNVAALDGINSVVQFAVRDNFFGYAGATFAIGGSAIGFISNTFHFNADSGVIQASSGVNDEIHFVSDDRFDADATNIVGNTEVVSFTADTRIDLNVAPGNYFGKADSESDESIFVDSKNLRINAGGVVTHASTKGDSYISASGFLVQATSYDLVANTDLQIVALTLTAAADISQTWNLQTAFFDSQRLDVTAKLTDITLEGEIITFWASQEGDFTADAKITVNTVGDLNFSAYDDITVSNLIKLTSGSTLGFEANRYVDFVSAKGDILFDNIPGSWYLSSDNDQSIVSTSDRVVISASEQIFLDSGYVDLIAQNDVLCYATDFSVDTVRQENVYITYDTVSELIVTAPLFAVSSGNILFDVDGVNTVDSEGVLSVTATTGVDIALLHPVQFTGKQNVQLKASNDILLATTGMYESTSNFGDTSFTFDRYWDAHLQGRISYVATEGMFVNAGKDLTIIQHPGVAQDISTTISAVNYDTVMSGSFVQNGGSTTWSTGAYTVQSTDRILLGSFSESIFTLSTGPGVNYDSTPANSNVILTSSDLDVHASGAISFTGGNVLITSDNSEYLKFEGQTLVSLTSSSSSPITWAAVYDWNVTAVGGLVYTANDWNMNSKSAISLKNDADTFSDVNFFVRDGTTTLVSNDTQTWNADRIVLRAASDIYYKNPWREGVSGGVLFDSKGSDHDGLYGDEAGISLRTTNANGWIWFNITLGKADFESGYDLHQIVTDSQSRFYSDEGIKLLAQLGDIDITSAGGSVVFQSTQRNVIWTTSHSTELQASGIVDTLAGKEINLVSNSPVSKFPQENYHLGIEFSAQAGSIVTQANSGFPIHFLTHDWDSLSGEVTRFLASDQIPISTTSGHFYASGETGLYYAVENGDLNLTAAVNITVDSSKNNDIRVLSGLDSTWIATTRNFTSLAGIDTILRTERNSATFSTLDSTGNIAISGGGIVRFQSDGTDDSVGGVNVDGIFFDAPNINSYSQDQTLTEAEVLYTVGLQTRPIIHLTGGGDAEFRGVSFTAEGNVNQDIGQNFLIDSQGSFYVNTNQDLDYLATGAVSIVSLGTNPVGKNIRFVTDGELDVTAANIQSTANRRITFYSDELLTWKSTGTNPTNSYISLDIVDDLRSYVDNIMDFNAADWAWTATTSFDIRTLGNVEIVNPTSGAINLFADTNLEFVSDVNMLFETTGANADLNITTSLSNSNLILQTWYKSSDILFNSVGNFVASSVNEANLDSHGPTSITAPFDSVGSSTLSTINFNSADDFSVLAAGGFTMKANDGMVIQVTGPDSDFEVDSDGKINVIAWQDGVFSSVRDSLSFTTAYNFTFANQPDHGGSIVFSSTRDIVQDYRQMIIGAKDDLSLTATHTFEFNLINGVGLGVTTTGEDSDITGIAQAGPVIIHTFDHINFYGGDTYFTAQTTATINVDSFTLSTSGIHDRVQFDASNVLNFNGGDISFITDTSTTNGLAFQDFLATGHNAAGGYSMLFTSKSNTNILAQEGGVDFWADSSITSSSRSLEFYADNFFPLAGYGLAVSASDGNLFGRAHDVVVTSTANNIVSVYRDEIILYPFETSTLEGKGTSQDYEGVGVLFQTNHESSDIRIFSTDFLIADLQFIGNSVNLFAEESITMLLLDDDDTQFVGTYLFEAATINIAAENEIYVQETSTGDIAFTGSGIQYFTAGDMFTLSVREQLLFQVPNWDVGSEGSFTIGAQEMDIDLTSQYVSQATDAMIFDVEGDFIAAMTNSAIIQLGDTNANIDEDSQQELVLMAQEDQTFTVTSAAGSAFITVSDGTPVDFRDGLRIPFITDPTINPGVTGCVGTNYGGPGSFFYETITGLLCYCDVNTLQCVQTFAINII